MKLQITNLAYIDGLSDGVLGKEKCYHKTENILHPNNEKSYAYYIQEYDRGFAIGCIEKEKENFC